MGCRRGARARGEQRPTHAGRAHARRGKRGRGGVDAARLGQQLAGGRRRGTGRRRASAGASGRADAQVVDRGAEKRVDVDEVAGIRADPHAFVARVDAARRADVNAVRGADEQIDVALCRVGGELEFDHLAGHEVDLEPVVGVAGREVVARGPCVHLIHGAHQQHRRADRLRAGRIVVDTIAALRELVDVVAVRINRRGRRDGNDPRQVEARGGRRRRRCTAATAAAGSQDET